MTKQSPKLLWSVKDARSIRTREALRLAFMELLEQKTLDQITIREIAAAAEVGYTTFFRHYSAKEEILNEIATDQIHRLSALTDAIRSAQDTRISCLVMCDYVDEHRALWTTLLTGGAAGVVREEFIRASDRVAAERGVSTDWLPADLGVVLSVSVILEIFIWWLRQPDPLPAERVAEIMDRVMIGPAVHGTFKE